MEIEILTTKKKLSVSFIKQLPFIYPKNLENISFLGGLRNIRSKDSYYILCQNNETKEYFLLSLGYNIENKEEREIWFAKYDQIIKETPQIFV